MIILLVIPVRFTYLNLIKIKLLRVMIYDCSTNVSYSLIGVRGLNLPDFH